MFVQTINNPHLIISTIIIVNLKIKKKKLLLTNLKNQNMFIN